MPDRAAPIDPLPGTLATLQRQFEAGAQRYPFLNSLLVSAPRDQGDKLAGPFPVFGCSTLEEALGGGGPASPKWVARRRDPAGGGYHIGPIDEIVWDFGRERGLFCVEGEDRRRKVDDRGREVLFDHILGLERRLFYVGGNDRRQEVQIDHISALGSFNGLAEQAGRCLARLPARALHDVVPDELSEWYNYVIINRKYDALLPPGGQHKDRWIRFIYWLAWRGTSVLKADRSTWFEWGQFRNVIAPWSPTREACEQRKELGGPSEGCSFESTRHYFAILEGLFLASVHAIDWMLAGIAAETIVGASADADAERVAGPTDDGPSRSLRRGELDERATAILMGNPQLTNQQIANMLKCHVKSLSNKRMAKFRAARETLASARLRYARGDNDEPGSSR